MNTTITPTNSLVAIATLCTLPWLSGCGRGGQWASPAPDDPGEMLQFEVDYLAGLEKDRSELVGKFKSDLGPVTSDGLAEIDKLVDASKQSGANPVEIDPRVVQEGAASKAELNEQAVARLLEALGEKSEEERARIRRLTEEFRKKLESLDRDIAAQKQQVEQFRRDVEGEGAETE